MNRTVAPPGREENKTMVHVRSIDPPFLEDDTITAVGAPTKNNEK